MSAIRDGSPGTRRSPRGLARPERRRWAHRSRPVDSATAPSSPGRTDRVPRSAQPPGPLGAGDRIAACHGDPVSVGGRRGRRVSTRRPPPRAARGSKPARPSRQDGGTSAVDAGSHSSGFGMSRRLVETHGRGRGPAVPGRAGRFRSVARPRGSRPSPLPVAPGEPAPAEHRDHQPVGHGPHQRQAHPERRIRDLRLAEPVDDPGPGPIGGDPVPVFVARRSPLPRPPRNDRLGVEFEGFRGPRLDHLVRFSHLARAMGIVPTLVNSVPASTCPRPSSAISRNPRRCRLPAHSRCVERSASTSYTAAGAGRGSRIAW